MSLEQRLNKAWYGSPGLLRLLLPVEALFRFVAALRRRVTFPVHFGVPVIVVGNITVGGSGKTPVVMAIANYLHEQGYRPGIVSRGHGGEAPHYPFVVGADCSPEFAGDEPCLMAKRTGLPVVVAPRRVAAIETILARYNCDVIISDDGLQHYQMARDIEVLVIDGQRGFGNGHCLPVGPLREPASRADKIPLRVSNGPAQHSVAAYEMALAGSTAVNLVTGEHRQLADWPSEQRRVYGVAGIGNPARFFTALRAQGIDVVEQPFGDHYAYQAESFEFADALPIIMTEKDAVKCTAFASDNMWMLPVDAKIDALFFRSLKNRLENS